MNKYVLVIGNKELDAGLVELVLRRVYGDQLVVVDNAQEAFEYLAQQMPDLVVFTYRWIKLGTGEPIPGRKSEEVIEVIDLYRQFLERWPDWHVPTLALTSRNPKLYDPVLKAAGLMGHVCWPFGPQELIAACEAVLRGEQYFQALESE